MTSSNLDAGPLPELPWRAWEPTLSTVHRWLQIVGRVRMVLTPKQPHWAHVPLTVTDRGVSTGAIPHASGSFAIEVDFIDHRLAISRGGLSAFEMALAPMPVARFYATLLAALAGLGIDVVIPTMPAEGIGGLPFERDEEHATYEPDHARAMWLGFEAANDALEAFGRANAGDGWTTPRLFWGSLDLATTRFGGPGSEQTAGWWPTSERLGPAFYAYAKPEPAGYRTTSMGSSGGAFDNDFGEFILTWDAAGSTADPHVAVQAFLLATTQAGRER